LAFLAAARMRSIFGDTLAMELAMLEWMSPVFSKTLFNQIALILPHTHPYCLPGHWGCFATVRGH
jgi:hypothetical protein